MPESGSGAREVSPAHRPTSLAIANSPARQSVRSAGLLEPYHDIASTFFEVSQDGDLDEVFLTAARDGDFAKIDALLRRRNEAIINIDARDRVTGNTPLIWAAKRAHSKIVYLLLRHGADITLRNHEGQTAVEVASPALQSQILDSGEKGGAHRNLLQAAWQGNAKLVRKILGDNQVDINCRNSDGLTPLLLVTRDVQLFEKYGNRLARGFNPKDVVNELLNSRADPNAMDEEGRTALHYVSSSRALHGSEILNMLINEGCDIEARDRRFFTPIHCASQSGNVEIVVALLDSGSEANVRGYAGATPLHISAINGHDNVVNKLLQRGADVTIVDDSGLTPVDVAKTKKVKATLKQAWAEATTERSRESLKPVRGPGSATSPSYEAKPSSSKKRGQVIFDLRQPTIPMLYNPGQSDPRYSMYLCGPLTTSQIELNLPTSSASSLDALTPRRAAVTMLQRQLTNAEKVRKAEEQKLRDVVSASSSSRSRNSSATTPRGISGRRLSPLRNPSPTKQSRREIKFSPGTKDHDGGRAEPESARKSAGQRQQPAVVRECSIPVTILGLDLDDNLQEVRVKRLSHGPMGQLVSKKSYYRSPSSDSTGEPNEEFYLRGHSSKASMSNSNDEWEEASLRSVGMRTPSASSRLHTIEERSTTSDKSHPILLDLDQMHVTNHTQSPIHGDASLDHHPFSNHLLPPTPVYMSVEQGIHHDMRVSDMGHSSGSSKENSPRSEEEMEAQAYCGDIKLAVGNVQDLVRPKSVLNKGNFSIEATRVTSSNDSGFPEEASPSSSNNSSDGTTLPIKPTESQGKPRNSRCVKKVSQDNNGAKPSSQNKVKVSGQPELDKSLKDTNSSTKGQSANMYKNTGAKLRQVSMENAAAQSNKTVTIKPVPVSPGNQRGSHVTVHDNTLQHVVVKEESKSMPASPVKNPNTSPTHKHKQQNANSSISVPNSPVKQPTITPSPIRPQQAILNKDTKIIPVNQSSPADRIKITLKPNKPEGPVTEQTKTPPSRPPPPNSAGKTNVSANAQTQGTSVPGARPIPPPRNKLRTPSASSVSSNESSSKEAPARPPPPNRSKTTTTVTANNKAGKPVSSNVKKNKPTLTKSTSSKQNHPKKKTPTETASFRLSTYIAQRDAMASSNQANDLGVSKEALKSAQPMPNSIGPAIILTSQSQKHFDLSGITDINNPNLISKDENQNEKMSGLNRQVTQIRVKEMAPADSIASSVDLSQAKFVEKPNQEETNGPVIWDPFEAIRDQIKAPTGEDLDKSKAVRARSATKRKAFERQTSSAATRKVPVSKGKESKVVRKKVGRPKSPRERSRSPRAEKKGKKGKKKGKKDSKDTVEAIVNENGETNVAFIGGLGWQISTECNDNESLKPLNLNKPALAYDSDEDDYPTPRLTVKPNYLDEEVIVSDLLFSDRQNDDMYGSQFLQLPGQLEFGDSDTSDNSEFGDDDIEDLLPGAEETVSEVVFDCTPRVGNKALKEQQKGKLLKPKRVPLRRGGTEDDDMEVIVAEDQKNVPNHERERTSRGDSTERKAHGSNNNGKKSRNNSKDRTTNMSGKKSPQSSPRTSPRVTPRSSPMASPVASPKTSPKVSPRRSGKVTPRSSPRSSPYTSPSRAADKGATPRATATTKTKGQSSSEKKTEAPQAPPRKSRANKDGKLEKGVEKGPVNNKPKQDGPVGRKSERDTKDLNVDAAKSNALHDDNKDGKKAKGQRKSEEKPLRKSGSKENENEIDAMIDEILKSTPHPSMSLSLKSQSGEEKVKPERTEEELLQISINARNKLQTELNKSQNGKLFCELKQTKDANGEQEEAKDEAPLTVAEEKELEKIMHSLRNMELTVSDKKKSRKVDQNKDESLDDGLEGTAKKPPLPPGASIKHSEPHPMEDKSPRFVRKVNSWKDALPNVDSYTKQYQDEEDLEALVNLSLAGSEFHSDALSMASGFNDDSMVPTDGRVMTSRIGRRNSIGRVSAMSNNESSAEENVETIQWKRGNMLGKGAYGKVWCGLTNKGELIAVKQIELNINDMEQAEEEYEKIQEEVELLKTLKHPNIVGYLGTSLEDNLVNIFMQFVPGGSIANILARFGALEEDVFCLYTKQIVEGVAYLHQNNVIHRDIKGGNIMVMHNGIIKLIDFGCAKRLCLNINSLNNSHARLLKSMRGTPYWMAPEVVKETGYGTKSDIWSIGCTVYEMATRKPPWADFPPMAAIFAIGSDREVPQLSDKFTQDAQDFVSLCMTKDENHRPSAGDLLTHPFVLKKRRQ